MTLLFDIALEKRLNLSAELTTVDVTADDTLIIRNSADGAVMKIKFSTLVAAISSAFGDITVSHINKVAITQPASSATLTIPNGVTLNAGAGGTLGSAAFTASSAYQAAGSYASAPVITNYTPTDQSGAGLTFGAATQCIYFTIGRLVFMSGRIQYPATANTADAAISLPVVCGVAGQARYNATGVVVGGGTANKIAPDRGAAVAYLYTTGNTAATNAGQTGAILDFSVVYLGP